VEGRLSIIADGYKNTTQLASDLHHVLHKELGIEVVGLDLVKVAYDEPDVIEVPF
jgi:hypothetical protein